DAQLAGSGSMILQGASTIFGDGLAVDGGYVLENQGQVTWLGGTLLFGQLPGGSGTPTGGIVRNDAGATFTSNFNQPFGLAPIMSASSGASALFDNRGTFIKSSGFDGADIPISFLNSGTVEVGANATLGFDGGGTQTGSFTGSGQIIFGGQAVTF